MGFTRREVSGNNGYSACQDFNYRSTLGLSVLVSVTLYDRRLERIDVVTRHKQTLAHTF